MKKYSTIAIIIISLAIVGCATARINSYEKFAQAGIKYSTSLNNLLLIAQKTAIDSNSAQLLATNSLANRNSANFHQQEIQSLEQFNNLDSDRIKVFSNIRKQVASLSGYFTLLNELATTDEAEKTSQALAASAKNIDDLSKSLGRQEIFGLDDAQKTRISKVVAFVISAKQRAALRDAIERDHAALQGALKTHEELLGVIGDDLEQNMKLLNLRQAQMLLETPFTAAKPLLESPDEAQLWMEHRRKILITSTTPDALKSASNAAGTLQKALEKLLKEDQDFTAQLLQLIAELESIRAVVEVLK